MVPNTPQTQGNNAFMLPNNMQQNGNTQWDQNQSIVLQNNSGQYNNMPMQQYGNQIPNNSQVHNRVMLNRKWPGMFVNLHAHCSEGSIQDALKIDYDYVKNFIDIGLALTDHGTLFALIDFYYNMKKIGKTPIFGIEAYTENFLSSKTGKPSGHKKKRYHLILLVKNIEGIFDLYKMVSKSEETKKSHDSKPIMSYDDIIAYSKNFVCLTACIGGELPQYILHGQMNEATNFALEMKKIFGDDFYIEIQRHGMKEEDIVNPNLIALSRQLGIGLVATSDAHYSKPDEKPVHDALQAKRWEQTLKDNPGFDGTGYHLLTPQEAEMLFFDLPDALDNTIEIFNKCKNVADDFESIFPKSIQDYHFPKFPTPNGYSEADLFKALCIEGFNKRFSNQLYKLNNLTYINRLNWEINTILSLNFPGYFLIVSDITSFCRKNDILVGPGRGSVAGSLVAYCMGITDMLDPIEQDLLFERFLNIARQSAPDIDLDFDSERREEIIEYLKGKYGEDHVAQIITFGTLGAKAAIADATKVLGESFAFGQSISKLIPSRQGTSLKEAFEKSQDLVNRYNSEPKVKEIIDLAFKFEGLISNVSKHAAGVVISDKPLTNYLPTAMVKESDDKKKKGEEQRLVKVTQFTMTRVEELGLLKIDILGLGTLTHIKHTLELINKPRIQQGLQPITMQSIPLNDLATYKMLGRGDTAGLFQVAAMAGLMRQLFYNVNDNSDGWQCFADIVAGISLNRPGPMAKIPQYIQNRANPNAIMYAHPNLVPVLKPSYGCLIYQEQVSLIAQVLAGFSPEKSDLFRRAVSKKKLEIIEAERQPFIYGERDNFGNVITPGALNMGVSIEVANQIFNEFVEFCKYAFNKSHGAAYAILTVITAYLKCHYPMEFMAALLSRAATSGDNKKLPNALAMCQSMNIEILPPDINKSQALFSMEGERSIRFGLAGVKQLGINSVNKIIEEREREGVFTSYQTLVNRLHANGAVNKKILEGLIYSGALDSFQLSRKAKVEAIETVLNEAKQGQNYMSTLFNDIIGADPNQLPDCKEYNKTEMLTLERDFLGAFVSENPLEQYNDLISNLNIDTIKDFANEDSDDEAYDSTKKVYPDGTRVKVIAYISEVTPRTSKRNPDKKFLTFEALDQTGTIRGTANIKYEDQIKVGNIVYLSGKLEHSEQYGTQLNWADVGKIVTKGDTNIKASELQINNNTVIACQIKNANEMQKFVGISNVSNLPPHVNLYFTCLTTRKHYIFNEKVALQDQKVLDFLTANSESLIIR